MNKQYFLILLAGLLVMPAVIRAQSTSGRAYVGYAKYDDQIWEYDGLSLDMDAKVGCAVILTKEMIRPYVGGTIVGMRVGWDTSTQTGTYEGFVRNSLNGEDLTSGKATVRYSYTASDPGWNNMTLTRYQIPEDVEQLVVGFTTTLKKGVCAIPTFYPRDVDNSNYLWVDGDFEPDGSPHWIDMKDRGILPILLSIQDSEGTFNYVPVITALSDDGVVKTGEASTALMRIKNMGSQTIRNIEVTSRQGDDVQSQKVTLSKSVSVGTISGLFMSPLYCFRSGDVELSITKVNDQVLATPPTCTVNLIGIPSDVSKKYKKRPLLEYYESENSYMSPRYYDEYVEPSIMGKLSKLTFVSQHMDDQFMTGDDDATVLALRLCDNDSTLVSIPAMTVDRGISSDNISYQLGSSTTPMFSVLLDPYASQTFNAAMNHPTFVAVNAEGNLNSDGETLDVFVDGDVATGVMPEGERPRLTVYLMERFVETNSQIFWTEKEKEEQMGHYVHANVIREILSDTEGDAISSEGDFKMQYTTQLDPSWNTDNLYIVAFVHRDGQYGGKRMQVFNSTEGDIDLTNGISNLSASLRTSQLPLYDLSGRRVLQRSALRHGIYLSNGKKMVR